MRSIELLAPAKTADIGIEAIKHGADAVYIGAQAFGARAAAGNSIEDIARLTAYAHLFKARVYATVNTIIYEDDLPLMRRICDAARAAGVTAIIAADVAVLAYCHDIGQEVHLSTQLNISNTEALRFYARYADVVVLARELNLDQVAQIHRCIVSENLCGPSGRPVRIEMFCHGALCMAVSGKCYLSLHNLGHSANRGECMQVCRRSYTVRDRETGVELDVDNKYIMSPKDLKTIGFLDRMVQAGVSVFKIEGRARSAEYVYTVVRCYKEALAAVADGTFSAEKVKVWDERLGSVFNRGFWDGYYLGQRLGEWSATYGSSATEHKEYVGKGLKYFSRLGVGEFLIEAGQINCGDRLLVIGPTTGALYITAAEMHLDRGPTQQAVKGQTVAIKVDAKIRPSDKLYRLVRNTPR